MRSIFANSQQPTIMLDQFKSHINNSLSFLNDAKLVIAVSGGIDSVVLAHLCHALKFNFALAHCNFNLRDEESNADEAFVLDLAEQLNAEVFIQNFDTKAYADENKCSIQMAARELRYNWFKELAEQLHFDYILTAHHADDNLETFLINFTRGTGLNGLTGIPEVNDNIVRPLLKFSRTEIEAYANEQYIQWREDCSNSSRKYLRNKLRHDVVPILKTINPQLLDSFQNTLDHLNDTAAIVEESLKAVTKRAIASRNEHAVTYHISEFKKLQNPKAYLFEMFKNYGFTAWNDVVHLLNAETGKHVTSQTHQLIKHREFLILTECHTERSRSATKKSNLACHSEQHEVCYEEKVDFEVSSQQIDDNDTIITPIGTLNFKRVRSSKLNTKTEIFISADNLEFPLQLRPWQTGDIFYPLGMKGKKKLSKYLKDEKLTPHEKAETWVLLSNNNVVWVIGKRADDRFKVTHLTNKFLKIKLG